MTITATPATVKVAPKALKLKVAFKPKAVRAVIAHSNAKRAIKRAEERKARAEAIIRDALGDAEIGLNAEGLAIVEVMHSTNSKFDREVLEKRFPDAYAAARVETPYTYLKTI